MSLRTGKRGARRLGYVIAGLIMAGGVVELVFGIKADRPSLETVTKTLTAVADERSEEDVSDE